MSPSLSGQRNIVGPADLSEKVRKEVTARLVTNQVTNEGGVNATGFNGGFN
jgi:hypothetical protein